MKRKKIDREKVKNSLKKRKDEPVKEKEEGTKELVQFKKELAQFEFDKVFNSYKEEIRNEIGRLFREMKNILKNNDKFDKDFPHSVVNNILSLEPSKLNDSVIKKYSPPPGETSLTYKDQEERTQLNSITYNLLLLTTGGHKLSKRLFKEKLTEEEYIENHARIKEKVREELVNVFNIIFSEEDSKESRTEEDNVSLNGNLSETEEEDNVSLNGNLFETEEFYL